MFGNGAQFGLNISYKIQPSPDGIAQAFLLAQDFIKDDDCALILGDNIFYGQGFSLMLKNAVSDIKEKGGAKIFAYQVKDSQRFGVVEFDENNKAISLEEKPEFPKSNYAITGLYFYDNNVIKYAKTLKPSKRNELEITDLNRIYLEQDKLNVEILGRGFAWLDTGEHSSLLRAGQYIQTIEQNQGIKIACLEEIAYRQGFISREQLIKQIENMPNNEYYDYVRSLV